MAMTFQHSQAQQCHLLLVWCHLMPHPGVNHRSSQRALRAGEGRAQRGFSLLKTSLGLSGSACQGIEFQTEHFWSQE